MKCGVLVFCTLVIQLTWAKPGDYDYGAYGTEYVGIGADIGGGGAAYGSIADSPAALITTTDLKPASTFEYGYGGHPEPIGYPFPFPIRSYGGGWGGWKQPQPIIAPIPVITKPIHLPILPFGWGWQNPGIF
ncbi:unnamed protein product [Orchesella dallaii]|uniref:Uncharacterized protein n=1 Tax=Orchesella dallaii TaxID=48710 RepID=A0ABP1QLH9_9HEXA